MNEDEISTSSYLLNPNKRKEIRTDKSVRCESVRSFCCKCYNVIFIRWINRIFHPNDKNINLSDYTEELSQDDKASILLKKLFIYNWSNTKTWRIIFQAFAKETFFLSLLALPYVGIRVVQPIILRIIIQQINTKDFHLRNLRISILSAFGLLICFISQAILYQQVLLRSTITGRRINNALTQIIYQHLLSINLSSLQQITYANTIGLVVHDLKKFEELWFYGQFLWAGPLEAIITFGLLSWIIGIIPTCFGFCILLLLIPIQYLFSRKFTHYCQMTLTCTDKRINAFTELLNGFLFIKMSNWEKIMKKCIDEFRQKELQSIKHANNLRAINMSLYFGSIILVSLVTFSSCWLLGYELIIDNVFIAFVYLAQIRLTLVTLMTNAIERLSEMLVASNRIDKFMRLNSIHRNKSQLQIDASNDSLIIMCNASFSWESTKPVCLSLLNLDIKPGEIIGIVGPVGSGKSSLLAAILGEMNLMNGNIYVNGTISYSAQTAWILADTIRANIILGKEFNEKHYRDVLQACSLDVDLEALGPNSDLTIMADKGINLSTGQKARISLARALYADMDIYLLDDPLAAVDQKLAKEIFHSCIGSNGLLKGKTCLLITHQIQFLTECNRIILINNGCIEVKNALELINSEKLVRINFEEIVNDHDEALDFNKLNIDNVSIVKDEIIATGGISCSLWFRLFTAPPTRYFGFYLLIFLLIIGEISFDTTNCWLFYWSSKTYIEQQMDFYAYIYLILSISTFIFAILRAYFWFYVMLCGTRCLHDRMLKGILYTSMRFIESNPMGRIINRISHDQQIVDEIIPITLFDAVQELLIVFGSIIIISIINPFILLLFLPLGIAGGYLTRSYLRSSRHLRRIECSSRSPIYSLFSSSIDGLTTIRAFQVKDDFLHSLMDRIDIHSRAFNKMTRDIYSFGLKLDILSEFFAFITILILIIMHNKLNSLSITISLVCCLSIPNRLQWSIRQLVEVENYMVHVERIYEYAQLKQEEDNGADTELIEIPRTWPHDGTIEFQQYTLRYRPELGPVLQDININITANEKIGIIGRTGK